MFEGKTRSLSCLNLRDGGVNHHQLAASSSDPMEVGVSKEHLPPGSWGRLDWLWTGLLIPRLRRRPPHHLCSIEGQPSLSSPLLPRLPILGMGREPVILEMTGFRVNGFELHLAIKQSC